MAKMPEAPVSAVRGAPGCTSCQVELARADGHAQVAAGARWREPLAFILVALLVRACLLVLDARPRFFLGDSEAYLETAVGHLIPPDRSWMYGLAINLLLRVCHTLSSIVSVQSLASAALCASIAMWCRAAAVRAWIAWTVLLMLSVDPLLLYYDRSIMTDAPGAAAVALGVLLAADWLASGRWGSLGGSAVALWAAMCLRTALLPLIVWVPAFTVVRVVLRLRSSRVARSPARCSASREVAGAAALVLGVLFGIAAYAFATGKLTESRPSLNPRGGYFLIGLVAPILVPGDFAGLGVEDPARLLEETRHREATLRNWQVFGEEGIARRLEKVFGDFRKVSNAGSVLARRAIMRDPGGFAELCATQAWEYLTVAPYRRQFGTAFGLDRSLSGRFVPVLAAKLREPVDAGLPSRPSLLLDVLRLTIAWPAVLCWLALLAPAGALVAARALARSLRPSIMLVATSTWVYLASVFALSPELVPRYLLPAAPLAIALLAFTVETTLRVSRSSAAHLIEAR